MIKYDITCTEDLKDIIEYHILGEEVRPDFKLCKIYHKDGKAGCEINLQNENIAIRWRKKEDIEVSRDLINGTTFYYADDIKVYAIIRDFPDDPALLLFINFVDPDTDITGISDTGIVSTTFGVEFPYKMLLCLEMYDDKDFLKRKDSLLSKLRKNQKLELVLFKTYNTSHSMKKLYGIDSMSHFHDKCSCVHSYVEMEKFVKRPDVVVYTRGNVGIALKKHNFLKLEVTEKYIKYRNHTIDFSIGDDGIIQLLSYYRKDLYKSLANSLDKNDLKSDKFAAWVLEHTLGDD